MPDPTFTISIDRTSMAGSPAPLVFSGTPGVGEYGFTGGYQEPVAQPRIRFATPSDYENDDDALGFTLQSSILGWNFVTDASATEQESRDLVEAVRAALLRLEYEVTVTINGATAEVWTCKPGTVTPLGDRTRADLVDHNPGFSVTIPCHPVRNA